MPMHNDYVCAVAVASTEFVYVNGAWFTLCMQYRTPCPHKLLHQSKLAREWPHANLFLRTHVTPRRRPK